MEKTKRKKTTSKYGSIPQQERSKQTVEKVLKVAAKLFTKHGVAAVNLGQIARQASIPTATIYRYYPNKEELIVRLMYDDLNIMISSAQEKLDSARNIEEFTSALLVVLWDTYEEIQDHPFLHGAFGALLSERTQKQRLYDENQKWINLFHMSGRRFIDNISDEHLRTRLTVLNAMWNATVRVAYLTTRSEGDMLMKEAISIFCRELALPVQE